ncbi:MAG: FAD-binding oxidoreductase [Desulfomonilaceae bacterium]
MADESRFRGHASALIRAREIRHVVETVKLAVKYTVRLTVVSGKTSLTGAPVPLGGVIIDLAGLDSIDPEDPSEVGPGTILKRYRDHLDSRGLFYPPDPTSADSCSIGGNVVCNASGALSYLYGPTRDYIRGLKIVLPTGNLLDIERGAVTSSAGFFNIPKELLMGDSPQELKIPVPTRGSRPWNVCKSSAGLYSSEPMDLVDLFIGSEGILGIVVQIRTKILPRRNPYFALMLYTANREQTVHLVTLLDWFKRCFHDGDYSSKTKIDQKLTYLTRKAGPPYCEQFSKITPACMEWFGASVAAFLSPEQSHKMKEFYGCMYVEQEYPIGEESLDRAQQWAELISSINDGQLIKIEAEVALDQAQIRNWREERKKVPEKLNESIRPGRVKVGMDYAVPMEKLGDLLKLYDDLLPAGKSYAFGHIGNAHIHCNTIPENEEEAISSRQIVRKIGEEVCKMGGSVSGEHGIGKLKHEALEMMLGPEGINEIKTIKKLFDPNLILNIGNMVTIDR